MLGQQPKGLEFAAPLRRKRNALVDEVADGVDAAVAAYHDLKRVRIELGHETGVAPKRLVGLNHGKLRGAIVDQPDIMQRAPRVVDLDGDVRVVAMCDFLQGLGDLEGLAGALARGNR
jgi:hypothetical protein